MWNYLKNLKVVANPSENELREWSKKDEVKNTLGVPLYHSKTKSRSAKFTEFVWEITPEIQSLLDEVFTTVKDRQFIKVERNIGTNPRNAFRQVYFVPQEFSRLAFMMTRNNFVPTGEREPDIMICAVPDWKEKKILVFPKEHFTLILGTDYYGESKMAGLRMAMQIMRTERNGLGLHAGSKVYRLQNGNGNIKEVGALIFGLSGTGKTTISVNSHNLNTPEGVSVLQDDINMLTFSGESFGTERSYYVKTDSVTSTKELIKAVTSDDAVLENVYVSENGEIDFDNQSVSTNGRAVINRMHIPNTSDDIDLRKVNFFLFNTRRYDIPPVGRLTGPEQAAAFFMLGESTITSADDPNRVGESIRVVGFDPFIIGDYEMSGNRLYDILKNNPDVSVYVVNTGKVGGLDEGIKITPEVTLKLVENIARGTISWEFDPVLGYDRAVSADGVDLDKYDPYKIYGTEKFTELMSKLKEERKAHLANFPKLYPQIPESIK